METKGMIQNAAGANAVSTKARKTMKDYIRSMSGEIAKALPSVMTPERFTRITLSALSATPELQNTTPQSFLGAMMAAAQLGLEPNTSLGQAYLIPYKNKGVLECQFQLGYRGMIDLAYRSGEVDIIQAHEVCENDTFEFEFGLEPKLRHVPARENRGKPISYYAVFKTQGGGYGFEVMSIEDIRSHAQKFSKSFGSQYSPWNNNFDEMAKKTVLKRVLKYAPLKSDFARAVAADSTINIASGSGDDFEITQSAIEIEPEYADVEANETSEVKK